ncbi:MAG: uracil-DNA glycosylase family protein [Alphaproteobacteria bacterium]|nr:uracil-DNA glycosylase family protein [Alphaproteobacteria bacterium SS10]
MSDLASLLARIGKCRHCADLAESPLPHEPRPVVRAQPSAELLIIGQAPGTRVHETGIPWNDPSGDRLRQWLSIDKERFYDSGQMAIMPMGFCFPGQDDRGADLPPRKECAPLWHDQILAALPNIRTILLIGQYAQARYLGKARKRNMTETVAAWRDYAPKFWPTPHPSWRNNAWLKKHPWFEADLLPALRHHIGG